MSAKTSCYSDQQRRRTELRITNAVFFNYQVPCNLFNKYFKISLSCLSVINLFKTFSVDFLCIHICIKVKLVAPVIHRETRDNMASLPFAQIGLRLNSLS